MKQKIKNITFIFRIPITNYRHNYIYMVYIFEQHFRELHS